MALFRNPKKTVYAIAAFILLACLAWCTESRAESTLHIGGGSTFIRGETPVLDLSVVWPEAGPRDASWQTSLTLIGDSDFDGYHPNQAALSVMLVDGLGPVDIGLGVAFLQNVDAYNGSHANFALQIGYRWKRWKLEARHFSNAGTVSPNKGRDMAILSYQF